MDTAPKLADKYDILAKRGEGGMGIVYKAFDKDLQRDVAIKCLSPKVASDSTYVARFLREATTLAKFKHPHIVQIHDFHSDVSTHTFYLVMEFVDGPSLAELRATKGRFSENDVLAIASQVLEALAYAHAQGVIHRDLKPGNILVEAKSRHVKLTDFGLALPIDGPGISAPNMMMGSLPYMPPEQFLSSKVTAAADIYAAGITFYELLVGSPPFFASSLGEWHEKHLNEPPQRPSNTVQVSRAFEDIILRALEKGPIDRYCSATDMLNAILELVRSRQGLRLIHHVQELVGQIPDLLTPGFSEQELVSLLVPQVGMENAQTLSFLSQRAIDAVERGDFDSQVRIAQELREYAPVHREIGATAYYFAGEGYRLLADLEDDPLARKSLLAKAHENYSLSLEVIPNRARALRGIGRIMEIQGQLGEAEGTFNLAKAQAVEEHYRYKNTPQRFLVAHELIRVMRHHIHCIIEILNDNPDSHWHSENKLKELEGHIWECQNVHEESLKLFDVTSSWARIEWFMGLVFLAKAWGHVGNYTEMTRCLLHALVARRDMLSQTGTLTDTERANLVWWHTVAVTARAPYPDFEKKLLSLYQAITDGERKTVIKRINEIVKFVIPPWNI